MANDESDFYYERTKHLPAPEAPEPCPQCAGHYAITSGPSPHQRYIVTLQDELTATRAEIERLKAYQRDISVMLSDAGVPSGTIQEGIHHLSGRIERLKAEKETLESALEMARVVPCDSLRCVVEAERDALRHRNRRQAETIAAWSQRLAALHARHEPLTALIAQWREQATQHPTAAEPCAYMAQAAVRCCADELEAALLAALPSGQTDDGRS